MLGGRPVQLRLETLHLGVAGIDDGGDAVLALHRGLHVGPFLVENRAVHAKAVIEPVGLPAELEIGQRVRIIGARRRQAIVAAGSKAGRPGEVDHVARRDLIMQTHLMRFAVLDDFLSVFLQGCGPPV